MTVKPAILRARARADVDTIVDAYLAEAGERVALAFVAALERAIAHVEGHPATGSLRYADLAGRPGLRFWPIRRFPHLVFYMEEDRTLDIWRVLHARRDIPEALWIPEPA